MNYKALGLSNLNIDKTAFSEDFLIYHNSLNQEFQQAMAEGIFSATATVVKGAVKAPGMAYRGASTGVKYGVSATKSAAYLTSKAMKMLWEMIKKIIQGLIKMIQNAITAGLDHTSKLAKLIPELQRTETDLKGLQIDPNDTRTYDGLTVRDMDLAGWNLANTDQNSANATVGKFLKLIIKRADGESPEDLLADVNSPESLFDTLDVLFQNAHKTFMNDLEMAMYTGWDKKIKKINSKMDSFLSTKTYLMLTPEDYGNYVAQANSPAGAFIVLNKFAPVGQKADNINTAKNSITPKISTNIPSNKAQEEFMKTCKYLYTLFNFITSIHVLDKLKEKGERLQRLLGVVNKLAATTTRERKLDEIKKVQYGNGETPETRDYNEGNNEENKGEGYRPAFILNSLDKLNAYGELFGWGKKEEVDPSEGATSYNDAYNQTAKAMNDQNSEKPSYNFNQNQTKQNKTGTIDLSAKDANDVVKKNGLAYLQAYLNTSGKVIFQEMLFYTAMTSRMHGAADNFLNYIKKTYIPAQKGDNSVNSNKNINQDPNSDNQVYDKENKDNQGNNA